MPKYYIGRLIRCPHCSKGIKFHDNSEFLGLMWVFGGGCLTTIVTLAVYLFLFGLLVIAALLFAGFVLRAVFGIEFK